MAATHPRPDERHDHGPANGFEEGGDGHDRRATTGDQQPRSVAEEAALLIDLLSRRGGFGTPREGRSTATGPAAARENGSAEATPNGTAGTAGTGDTAGAASPADAGAGDARHGAAECTCGSTTPAACRVCPVCQVIAFVQRVNPETIERLADFAAFAANALRDVAAATRERGAAASDAESEASTPRRANDADATENTDATGNTEDSGHAAASHDDGVPHQAATPQDAGEPPTVRRAR